VDLAAIVVSTVAGTAGRLDALALSAVEPSALHGSALLLHTGRSALTGRPGYSQGSGFLTRDGAQLLALCGVALVGIDSESIDDTHDVERPARTVLLAEGIPVIEGLTGLAELPAQGARFTAVPPRTAGEGTFPVRAFATVTT
jgi:kynurenine formamidase